MGQNPKGPEEAPGHVSGSGSASGSEDRGLDVAEAVLDQDYTTDIVPLSMRRPVFKMAILWATLNAALVVATIGYLARSQGMTLVELWAAGLLATSIALVYGFGAANLGTITGQTHTLLTRTIFGRAGSGIVSLLLITIGMGWYCFQAFFLSRILNAFFPLAFESGDLGLWAAAFAIVMITNNLIGFTGVMGYAVYVCTPLLIGWGLWAMIKGFVTVPSDTIFSEPSGAQTISVVAMSLVIIGGLTWGNEPDFFRWAKPSRSRNIPALLFGYVFGALFFTTAGYLMAELSAATDFGPMMKYFVEFSLFGLTAFGLLVFIVNVIASNDGNLYEAVNALQNLLGWKRYLSVLLLGGIGAVVASQMTSLESSLFTIAGIGGVFVPSATTIMVIDVFVVPRLFGMHRPVHKVTPWTSAAMANWIGIVALLSGLVLGVVTGGLIPGLPRYGEPAIGYPPLQAWVLSSAVYLAGVYLVYRHRLRYVLLGYPTDHDPAVDVRVGEPVGVPEHAAV